jgi:hypothetical protein
MIEMKKLSLLVLLTFTLSAAFAKRVKFAVDMTGYAVDSAGIHIASDFQKALGFPEDFSTESVKLKQEGTSNIFSIVVNIPAFKKYEFKYVNGDKGYQAEFVPLESRALFNFSDFRWLYVDSLRNDTTFVGAIKFEGNAPEGKTLVRFEVQLPTKMILDKKGIHLAGDFQGWNSAETFMYSFDGIVHEYIAYFDDKIKENSYKFINGNDNTKYEIVPGLCRKAGNRYLNIEKDTVLSPICYADCIACPPIIATNDAQLIHNINVFPNPFGETLTIQFKDDSKYHDIELMDQLGRIINKVTQHADNQYFYENKNLPTGIYFLKITDNKNNTANYKIIKND